MHRVPQALQVNHNDRISRGSPACVGGPICPVAAASGEHDALRGCGRPSRERLAGGWMCGGVRSAGVRRGGRLSAGRVLRRRLAFSALGGRCPAPGILDRRRLAPSSAASRASALPIHSAVLSSGRMIAARVGSSSCAPTTKQGTPSAVCLPGPISRLRPGCRVRCWPEFRERNAGPRSGYRRCPHRPSRRSGNFEPGPPCRRGETTRPHLPQRPRDRARAGRDRHQRHAVTPAVLPPVSRRHAKYP